MRDFGRAAHIFDDAEEIGRLNDDGRGLDRRSSFRDRSVSSAPLSRK
jgi:hypothetical protein